MDQRPKYEQVVAGKLQSLPVPDMQDAIWARVKAQLDLDMPADDEGGDDNPPPSSPKPGMIGWGLSVLLVVFIAAFILFKNKKETFSPDVLPQQITQPSFRPVDKPPLNNNVAPGPRQRPADNQVLAPTLQSPEDSVMMQDHGIVMAPSVDSNAGAAEPIILTKAPPLTPVIDSAKPGKKQRGVPGLKDEDYRVVPKKDN